MLQWTPFDPFRGDENPFGPEAEEPKEAPKEAPKPEKSGKPHRAIRLRN